MGSLVKEDQGKRATLTGAFPGSSGHHEPSIWSRFQVDCDRCRAKFAKLAKLPEWGSGPWQDLYAEAFQDYNKLWSTQQRYRLALTQAGLTRWMIGEIASKIGQLYYNYYSRKSDTGALLEAYSFYDAIRSRQYFHGVEENRSSLQQQLRYHARFLLVCLLLQEIDKASLVAAEMQALAMQLSTAMCAKSGSAALAEWAAVAAEAWACIEAETLVAKASPLSPPPPPEPRRLPLQCVANQCTAIVSHAIIISYRHNQLKLGALTMDALRLSQTLEWQPPASSSSGPPACCPRCPKKIIFYQAPASRVQSALGATIDSMQPSKTLLMFIGADRWPYTCPSTRAKDDCALAALAPAQWSNAAKKLSENGVTLIAPVLSMQHESTSTVSASAARNRRPSAGCADAGFQDSSTEHNEKEGDTPASSERDALTPDASLSGTTGASPSALTAILPSVQAGPQRSKRGPPRHSHSIGHVALPPAQVDASSPPWQGSGAPVLVSAPVISTNALDVDDVPHCHSATQPSIEAVMPENDLERRLPLQDSAKVSNRESGMASGMAAPAPPPTPEQMLLPVDLVPATRRGLLLIVDSNNSQVFTQLRTVAIGKPPLLLLSPPNPPDIVRLASVPEPIFTLFLTHPVLALIRLFRLDTTPALLASLHQAVDELMAALRTSCAARAGMTPTEQLGANQVGLYPLEGKDELDAYAAADAAKPASAPCSEDPRHPWEAALNDPFASRIVLRFALCRAVYNRAARLRAPNIKSGQTWGGMAGANGGSGDGMAGEGSSEEVGVCADTQLPLARPDLPEALAPDAPLLVDNVDLMLRDLCGVKV